MLQRILNRILPDSRFLRYGLPFIFLMIASIGVSSCASVHELAATSASSTPDVGRPTPTEMEVSKIENEIYSSILETLYYNGASDPTTSEILVAPLIGPEWILYRKNTQMSVTPDLDDLKSATVGAVLLSDFEERNRQHRELPDAFLAKVVAKPVKATGTSSQVFDLGVKTFPKANCLLSFSRMGVDSTTQWGLVYVEVYKPKSGRVGIYYMNRLNDPNAPPEVVRTSRL